MKKTFLEVILLFILLISGCVQTQTVQLKTSFDANESAYAANSGTGTIEGTSYFINSKDDIFSCARQKVFLLPYTSYTKEFFTTYYGAEKFLFPFQGRPNIKLDNRISGYIKESVCDDEGKISFKNIAHGEYIVETVLKSSKSNTSLSAYNTVSVTSGKKSNVIISDEVLVKSVEKDKFDGSVRYSFDVRNGCFDNIRAKIVVDEKNKPHLFAEVTYSGIGWIFISSARIKLGDEAPIDIPVIAKSSGRIIKSGKTVAEHAEIVNPYPLLKKISTAKKGGTLRIYGDREYVDEPFTLYNIEGIQWIVEQYESLIK